MVDDEVHILEVAKLSLERYSDYSLDTVSSPEDALETLKQKRYDVIVSDYEMPGMNGASLLKVLRARGDQTPFIILTSRGREEVAAECLSAGVDRYLQRSGASDSWIEMLQSEIDSLESRNGNESPVCPDGKGIICDEMYAILNDDPKNEIRTFQSVKDTLSRIHGRDRPVVKNIVQAVSDDGTPRSGIFRLRTSEGWSWQHGLFTVSATDSSVFVSMKSIDESRAALFETESIWGSISEALEVCPFCVDLIDSDWNLLYSNRFKVKGEKCYRAIKGRESSCEGCGLVESLHTGHDVRQSYNEQGKDIETQYIPITDEGGRPTKVVRLQKERETSSQPDFVLETILETNRKLHLLTSITRHDIINQLTAMMGYLELYDDFPEKRETIIGRMRELISNVDKQVTFTRSYQKLGITAPFWQDCSTLFWSAVEEMNIDSNMVSVESPLPLIFGDPMLGKVIANILSNSMMHGKKVTRIWTWFEVHDEGGRLFIADDGVGIPEEKKERIFDRGYGSNMGYGLFLSRIILDITGITITEVGEEGQGACFRIDLPANVYTLKIEK